jgi:hypothetical protein
LLFIDELLPHPSSTQATNKMATLTAISQDFIPASVEVQLLGHRVHPVNAALYNSNIFTGQLGTGIPRSRQNARTLPITATLPHDGCRAIWQDRRECTGKRDSLQSRKVVCFPLAFNPPLSNYGDWLARPEYTKPTAVNS